MASKKKLERARKRLKKAQDASAKFEAKYKGIKLTPGQETERHLLSSSELGANIDLSEAKKRPKPIRDSK